MSQARHPGREPWVSASRTFGLWLLVAVQLAIPAGYYLWRDDPDDERFSWRMFSALRFRACEIQASEVDASGAHAIVLQHQLHASWIGSLSRGRRRVIEKLLQKRCATPGVTRAWLSRSCAEVDGRALPRERFTLLCQTGALTRSLEAGP